MSHALAPRRANRWPVMLAAICRTQNGLRDNARIFDISSHGCRLETRTLALRNGMRVMVRPQGLEGLTGVVRWIDGHQAGIEFDSPLYEPVVDHLGRLHAANRKVYAPSC